MKTIWAACFVVLVLLACLDFLLLWKARHGGSGEARWFSGFTLAAQGAFAAFAAIAVAPEAFEGFSTEHAVQLAEIGFLVLMVAGAIRDRQGKPAARS